jgi:hypothetical protein
MLHDWNNFFNMTGTAGGQVIGLLFVAVTLAPACRHRNQ